MEIQVAAPLSPAAGDFNFESNCSSPYMTAPSTPQRFPNFYFSAPTSPSHSEQNPATQISRASQNHDQEVDDDFAFGKLDRISFSAADDLFHGGVIRPLKPPPAHESVSSVSSPKQRGSRSLSPIRVSDEEHNSPKSSSSSTIASILSFGKRHRKWKLRDLLLFRSASEGRATGKEAMGKYAMLSSKKAAVEDLKNSSFRSAERKRGPAVSAHEAHYTENRAAAEEMRKRTMLPYKQGLLGCLGFNPAGVNDISRGIGSLTRG